MTSPIERIALAPGYEISRIIKGGWQLSEGHGSKTSADPVADMAAFVASGITAFDCADIYTGVEATIGRYLASTARAANGPDVRVHTKYVPDYDELGQLTRDGVEAIIDRSRSRLGVERLDMVQFHWWNYAVPGWIEAAGWLRELQQVGKIELLSLTNFNTEKTAELLRAGIPLATTQVQYSLLDPRPEKALIPLCREHSVQLLCYGSLAGGFLSERWLDQPAPEDFENRSLIKYRLMIEEIGGWDLFQSLLATLNVIASRHAVSIASVAARWVLDQPQVAAVIIGARTAEHLVRYAEIFRFELPERDLEAIAAIRGQMNIPDLDVFDLERDKEGRHGRIMKYNLNAA